MIYEQFSPMLYRYAYRLLGEVQLAEDCVADTFTRFLHTLQRGGGPKKELKAYLYRTAHNWIVDRYRRAAPPVLELNPETVDESGEQPGDLLQAQEQQARLRAVLFELTPDQRQVVVLKYLENLSNREVAATVNKTVGAVKSLQHRALDNLRRLLEEPEGSE